MLQNKNRIVKALANADMTLTITGILAVEGASMVKMRPRIMNNGAPGGWPTSSLKAVVINSPQSQKLAVGSIVIK
jgi:hypothetical protein